MQSAPPDSSHAWNEILRAWAALDVPEGWRPEITPGGIVMTPPPAGRHNLIAASLHRAIVTALPPELGVFQTLGVAIRSIEGIFVPDLCVVARERVPLGSEPVPAEHLLLAVEITSPGNARHDRRRKMSVYAHGPVAQYLLIDGYHQAGPSVTLFSDPFEGAYRVATRTPFGQSVKLAGPLDLELITEAFPTDR